jgi:hypothetical protein
LKDAYHIQTWLAGHDVASHHIFFNCFCVGILEVFATAILLYSDAREKQGYEVSALTQRLAFIGNVVFQILASLAGNLFATWFGPASLIGPIFFLAQLVANMIIFCFVHPLANCWAWNSDKLY